MRGRGGVGLWVGLVALSGAEAAHAGAWNLPKGQGEIIVKYENIRAEDYFASDGGRAHAAAE